MKFCVLVVAAVLFTACQNFPFRQTSIVEPTPAERAAYRLELEKAWHALGEGEPEIAFRAFQNFQKEHPQTIFETEARFGEARALEEMGEWSMALKIYREISTKRMSTHPDLAALAMYYQSAAAEALGDESQMLATLQDAERNEALLPEEIRIAALPARLAVALTKIDQMDEAKKYLVRAEQGINRLKARGLSSEKWAQVYLEMGSFSTNQLAPENFQSHLDSFANGQIFLLKAVEAGVQPWSDRALEALQLHYRDFWNLAMNPPIAKGLDAGARDRMRMELQSRWIGEITRLANVLKQNQKAAELEPAPQERKVREFIADLEAEAQARLLDTSDVIPLTRESQKQSGLKRGGRVRSEPIFPVEKGSASPKTPVSVAPSSDPNLQKSGDEK